MNRGYYSTSRAPFLYTNTEPGSGGGMDCLQLRQPAGPFHYLISEQAKSLVALQELQHEVGALLEFRDLVIETFPNLRTKLATSTPPTMMSSHHHHHHLDNHHASNIPVATRRGDWEPGVRVRRKLNNKDDGRAKKTETTIQDSGFSTETSSKETHSASSTALQNSTPTEPNVADEHEDELWHLLDIIHRKGTRLKEEVESLQGVLREHSNNNDNNRHEDDDDEEDSDFERVLFHSSADDVRQLRRERDLLLDRVAEMEAEVLAGRMHTTRLQEDLENLLGTKHELEEQLKAIVTQRGEVNSRIHDLHLQFVATRSAPASPETERPRLLSGESNARSSSHHGTPIRASRASDLDIVLGSKVPKVKSINSVKIKAILSEQSPIVLQKHLLISTVENEDLQRKLDTATRLEIGLVDKLEKAREENEDLRSQLDCKDIELEGTKAQLRVLADQRSRPAGKSPDIIPSSDATSGVEQQSLSRNEITTASMKAMSPLPLNLQLDHSSSTESAQDQAESAKRSDHQQQQARRKPSKIPLVKSYAAPKPPGNNGGGKHNSTPSGCARSRSGESPGRPHSAQSWRHGNGNSNRSEGNSLNSKSRDSSLHKSQRNNGSLVNAKDSLTGKLRNNSGDAATPNSFGSGNHNVGGSGNNFNNASNSNNSRSALRKSPSIRRATSVRDSPESKVASSSKRKSQSQWILCSFNSNVETYPDSLDRANGADEDNGSVQLPTPTSETSAGSSAHNFQTANNFLWTVNRNAEFYDSIDSNRKDDSNLDYGSYRRGNDDDGGGGGGEDLAEYDSLEKRVAAEQATQ